MDTSSNVISNPFSNQIVFFGNSISDENHYLRQLVGYCAGIGTKYLDHFSDNVKFFVTEDLKADSLIISNHLKGSLDDSKKDKTIGKRIKSLYILTLNEFLQLIELKNNGLPTLTFSKNSEELLCVDYSEKTISIDVPVKSVTLNEINFIAIDFETANNYRRSACALGLVKVENGEIVEKREWLIKPTPFEMGYYQNQVHHINLNELQNEPTFDIIWDEVKLYLQNQVVVAHNGSFDFSVLNNLCSHYNLSPISYNPICSLQLSRNVWSGELAYGLSSLVNSKLKNYSFNHHNALDDAEACSYLFLKLIEELQINNINDLSDYYYSPSRRMSNGSSQIKKTFEGQILEGEISPFYDSEIVVTGTLDYFTRSAVEEIIKKIGGITASGVTSRTKYLVTGKQDLYKVGDGLKSSKVKKAEQLAKSGQDIQLINEEEFIEMLSSQ